jgi:hypothetical protein
MAGMDKEDDIASGDTIIFRESPPQTVRNSVNGDMYIDAPQRKPSKYAKLQYAALACGEFFRDELQFGNIETLSPRVAGYMKDLKELCFDALGDPSIADAAAIKRKVSVDVDDARTHHGAEEG